MPKSNPLLTVTVMGTGAVSPETVDLEQSFFEKLAKVRHSKFTPEPPPFVAPCTDGLLICYNVIRDRIGISGEAAHFKKADLELHPVLQHTWEKANKPMTIKSALLYFGFPERS